MNANELPPTSPEIFRPQLRFAEGWREILEAPDALDYQTWLSDLTDLSQQRLSDEQESHTKEAVLASWLQALEQVADIAIDPEEMESMSQAQIVETALITLQMNLDAMGWDNEGVAFTVANLFTGEDATIDIKELLTASRQ